MGELAALGSAALWAIASAMFASVARGASAVALNLIKTAVGLALTMGTLLVLTGRVWPEALSSEALGWLTLSGLIGLTIGDSVYIQALVRMGPRRALLLWALVPPLTALGAIPILGEPLGWGLVLGIAVTGAGVTWVLVERTADMPDGGSLDLAGLGLGLLAVACQVGGSLTGKLGGRGLDGLELTVVRLAAGTAGLVMQSLLQGQGPAAVRVLRDRKLVGPVLLATFLGTYVGLWLQMFALQNTLAGIVATLTATTPIFVLPIAHFVLQERVTGRAIAGAVIAVAGVGLLMALPAGT